jgi:hypothetical protein
VADRVQKHFFNGGVMTTASAQARIDGLAAQINLAVKGHSMRWGDYTKTPAYNATDWQNAVTVARNWLSNRDLTVVQQLKNYRLTTSYATGTAPLFPNTAAPVFNQYGGNVAGGFQLTMTSPVGAIYYTTNGADPRAIGGAVAGTTYAGALTLSQSSVTVKARVLNGAEWSALTEATFYTDTVPPTSANLAITEVHYHPAAPSPAEITAGYTDPDAFEFLEILNTGGSSVNLTGSYFASGLDYTFPVTVLAPGARLVLANNAAAFQMRYGTAPAGQYGGKLSNSGERLWLKDPGGNTLIDFTYGTSGAWPTEADGLNSSLVLRNPGGHPDPANPLNWRSSASPSPRQCRQRRDDLRRVENRARCVERQRRHRPRRPFRRARIRRGPGAGSESARAPANPHPRRRRHAHLHRAPRLFRRRRRSQHRVEHGDHERHAVGPRPRHVAIAQRRRRHRNAHLPHPRHRRPAPPAAREVHPPVKGNGVFNRRLGVRRPVTRAICATAAAIGAPPLNAAARNPAETAAR